MAQSTTNLGKIHVFPSETLYNQFKGIIADNDLALLKDDGAYIVAALLEQNGYVKFSNGLILQWGVINAPAFPDESQPVTFPIKFSKIPSVITAINQAKNSVSPTQLFTASINAYTTTSNMILHRYGGLTASDARVDWFAWSV